jgi:hypothetical protein
LCITVVFAYWRWLEWFSITREEQEPVPLPSREMYEESVIALTTVAHLGSNITQKNDLPVLS